MERSGSAITTLAPRGASQWALVLLMAVSFLSYPFFIKYFAHGLYQAVFILLVFITVLSMFFRPRFQLRKNALFFSPLVTGAVVFYFAYLAWLTIISLLYSGDGYSHGDLVRQFIKFSVAAMLFFFLPLGAYKWTMDKFTTLMYAASIAGILMTTLIFFNILEPVATLQLPTISARDTGLREFYWLGLTWGSIPFPGGVTISRLQSFSDEPGTFAFALLPAIAWAVYRCRRLCSIVMSVALLLTWSVGAIAAGAGLLFFYLLKQRARTSFLIVMAAGAIVAVAFYQTPLMEVLVTYLDTKFGGGANTSVSHRVLDIMVLFDKMESNPWGFGAGAMSNVIKVSLAIGWLRALAETGVTGFVAYTLSFALLIATAFRAALDGKGESSTLGAIVLVLAFAAFQRSRMDESLWHLLMIVAFIRFYLARYAVHAPAWLSGNGRKPTVSAARAL